MALQLMFLLANPLSDAAYHCLDGRHGHSSSRRDSGPGRSPPLRHCLNPPASDSGTTSNGGSLGWNVEAQGWLPCKILREGF
jgi:hypothetical protein